jgi:zinc protease
VWSDGDIPRDPELTFSRLANGMTVVVAEHATPAHACSLRLLVQVGSREEEDDERGMAHFVEHMAFRGTQRFPGTSLIDWFQRQGIELGADLNASTTFSSTLYGIDLQRNDPATVTEALEVLREFATAIAFEDRAIEVERGVIDAEEREGSSPFETAHREMESRLFLAGTRYDARPVIGDRVVRARFDAGGLRAFHARWYRPDNMAVVVVGDLDADAMQAMIRQVLGAMARPATPLPPRPGLGAPHQFQRNVAVVEPGRPRVWYHVLSVQQELLHARTRADLLGDVALETACEMAQRFLAMLEHGSATALSHTDVSPVPRTPWHAVWLDGVVIDFVCSQEERATALTACGGAIRQLLQSGFGSAFLDRVREQMLEELDEDAAQEATQDGRRRADAVAWQLADGDAPITAAQRREWLRPALLELTPVQCSAAFTAAFNVLPVFCSIGSEPPQCDELAAWNAAAVGNWPPIAEHLPVTREPWPYASSAVEAVPVKGRERPVPGVEEVRFDNGVRALLKRTALVKGEVQVSVLRGYGARTEASALMATAYRAAFDRLGLGHARPSTLYQLSRNLASWDYDAAYVLSTRADRSSLRFALEMLQAHCSDPGWDEAGLAAMARSFVAYDQQMNQSFDARRWQFLGELAGYRQPTEAELKNVTAAQLQTWWERELAAAPTTVIAVGDLDVEATVNLLARTFGRLPPCRAAEPPVRRALAAGVHADRQVSLADEKSEIDFVGALPAEADPLADAAISPLTGILGDRLYKRLREELGFVYAPEVVIAGDGAGRGFCLLGRCRVAIGQEQRVLELCGQELARLRDQGATQDELERVRAVKMAEHGQGRQTNAHWAADLARAHSSSDALLLAASYWNRVRDLSIADLAQAAARYLRDDAVSTLILRPRPQPQDK